MPELIPLSEQDKDALAQGLGTIAEKTAFLFRPAGQAGIFPAIISILLAV